MSKLTPVWASEDSNATLQPGFIGEGFNCSNGGGENLPKYLNWILSKLSMSQSPIPCWVPGTWQENSYVYFPDDGRIHVTATETNTAPGAAPWVVVNNRLLVNVVSTDNSIDVGISDGGLFRTYDLSATGILPEASTVVAGVTEYATDVESTQTVTDRSVTPSNLVANVYPFLPLMTGIVGPFDPLGTPASTLLNSTTTSSRLGVSIQSSSVSAVGGSESKIDIVFDSPLVPNYNPVVTVRYNDNWNQSNDVFSSVGDISENGFSIAVREVSGQIQDVTLLIRIENV